jgi:hypothetical protein
LASRGLDKGPYAASASPGTCEDGLGLGGAGSPPTLVTAGTISAPHPGKDGATPTLGAANAALAACP